MMDWKITYARRWNRTTKSYDPLGPCNQELRSSRDRRTLR